MTIAEKPHGRTRYNAGCRCATCKQANRDHQRRRRAKHLQPVPAVPPSEVSEQPSLVEGAVTVAVRAELAVTDAAQERPGLYAIAIRLAQLLDRDDSVPQFASAAHRLSEILGTLAKSATRRGRLAAVRDMTGRHTH